MRICFYSHVVKVEHVMKEVYYSGIGDEAKFTKEDQGWFILLDGSHEALHVGFDEPRFKVGDRVKVTLERA